MNENENFFPTNSIWVSKIAEFDADIKFVELVLNAPTISYRQKKLENMKNQTSLLYSPIYLKITFYEHILETTSTKLK
jgi:hypothetical protein